MSSEEKTWFEKELEGNPALQVELDFHKKVNAVLADKESIELKAKLDTIHNDIIRTTHKGKGIVKKAYRKSYTAIGSLAAIIVLLAVYLTSYNFSSDDLIGLYYKPAESTISFRNASTHNDILSLGMEYYDNHEYQKAIELFETVLEQDESQLGVNLYAGISHMELEEYATANSNFQTIIDQEPNPFVESATWYLGLCYLFTNDKDKAKEAFLVLVENHSYYEKDAKKLLRRL
jgi:tetratricopeptide (TPR) repeat protein